MRHLLTLMLVLGMSAGTSVVALAQSDLSAEQIVDRMLKQPAFGWDDAEAMWRMVLVDAKGARQERIFENLSRRKSGKQQTLMRFRAPLEVAGTAFLMLEGEKGSSEQHVYLPGLKRTRRIVGREREGSFMGSDFSYADFERSDVRNASMKRLQDEDIGGVKTFVLETAPKGESSTTYSKIEYWLRQDNYLPLRVRYYDKAGKLLKTLYGKRIRTIENRPVIVEWQIVNKQTGHSTEFFIDNIRSRKDLPDAEFTPTALEHG